MQWKIYYDDGSVYSDLNGSPFNAPSTGVIVVVTGNSNSEREFSLVHGKDAFYWNDDIGWWRGCDVAGLWDYLLMYHGPKAVIFGRTIRDDDFWKIVSRASKEGLD